MIDFENPLKTEGDEAFRCGQYEEALAAYTAALEEDNEHVPTLCNRSLTALNLGRAEEAYQDADAALELLGAEEQPVPPGLLAKAVHRKAEALMALRDPIEAVRTYRRGLTALPGSPELHAALRLAAEQLPVPWLAKVWGARIEAAQAPNPLSSRDGRLIKPVPRETRLGEQELLFQLEAALYPLQDEARDVLCDGWACCRRPGRAEAAFFRGAAYLQAGNAKQALKDARLALVYGPQLDDPEVAAAAEQLSAGPSQDAEAAATSSKALIPANSAVIAAPPPPPKSLPMNAEHGRCSAWPAALALHSAALEALSELVLAALSMARAVELDPGNEEYAAALERLTRRIPDQHAAALKSGGSAALEVQLAGEKEANTPEYLRNRPQNYYYFEWMKKRILQQYPELPDAVLDKLLTLEANELDMILQYPQALNITVQRLMGVLEGQGAEALQTYTVPLLSWEDYQAIKAEGPQALPPGSSRLSAHADRLLPHLPADSGSSGEQSSREANPGSRTLEAEAARDEPRAPAHHAVVDLGGLGGTPDADEVLSEAGSVDVDDICGLD